MSFVLKTLEANEATVSVSNDTIEAVIHLTFNTQLLPASQLMADVLYGPTVSSYYSTRPVSRKEQAWKSVKGTVAFFERAEIFFRVHMPSLSLINDVIPRSLWTFL
jgi:hypothetical protein